MLDMTPLQILFWAIVLPCLVLAWAWGEREERWAMALIISGSVASALVMPGTVFMLSAMSPAIFIVDGVILISLVKLSFSSQKYWPLWVASLQLITVATHLVELLIPNLVPKAYAIMQGIWVYPMCVAIVASSYGCLVARQRKQQSSSNKQSDKN